MTQNFETEHEAMIADTVEVQVYTISQTFLKERLWEDVVSQAQSTPAWSLSSKVKATKTRGCFWRGQPDLDPPITFHYDSFLSVIERVVFFWLGHLLSYVFPFDICCRAQKATTLEGLNNSRMMSRRSHTAKIFLVLYVCVHIYIYRERERERQALNVPSY